MPHILWSESEKPIEVSYIPLVKNLKEAFHAMILSASGWRKVFALGGEESHSSDLIPDDLVLCAGMAWVFTRFLIDQQKIPYPHLVLGLDSRSTGPSIAGVMIRLLVQMKVDLTFTGIVSIPQFMSLARESRFDGFIYLTASHNPVGHNGVKWGLSEAGILDGIQSSLLAKELDRSLSDLTLVHHWINLVNHADLAAQKSIIQGISQAQNLCRKQYWALCDEMITFEKSPHQQGKIKEQLRAQLRSAGLGLVAEFNGSARGLGIDQDYLEDLGVQVISLNSQPGDFVHRIVPEGDSLELCCRELEQAHAKNNRFILGYVPDCDGDRGNIVYFDEKKQKAQGLNAQEVFALCVISELANLVYYKQLTYDDAGHPDQPVAVVCNDATSLRIDRIALAFGAKVFRSEVGETNVVSLAQKLRQEGWIVRILGEGSNGGNITHPGTVRDPLSTVISLLKLLTIKDSSQQLGLFSLWCIRSHQKVLQEFSLADIIATLPPFVTTPAYEARALLFLHTSSCAALKAAYEAYFLNHGWKHQQNKLQRQGITSWEERNYEGINERCGFGPAFRSAEERGGLTILLKNKQHLPVGFLWMRRSGTEPVFRVMVDIEGSNPTLEQELLNWHVSMIKAADQQSS